MLNIVVYCYWEYFENSWERHWFICLSLQKWSCSRLVLYSHQHVQNSFFTVKFCPVALSDSSNERKSIVLWESHIRSIAQFVQIVHKRIFLDNLDKPSIYSMRVIKYWIVYILDNFGQFWSLLGNFILDKFGHLFYLIFL